MSGRRSQTQQQIPVGRGELNSGAHLFKSELESCGKEEAMLDLYSESCFVRLCEIYLRLFGELLLDIPEF